MVVKIICYDNSKNMKKLCSLVANVASSRDSYIDNLNIQKKWIVKSSSKSVHVIILEIEAYFGFRFGDINDTSNILKKILPVDSCYDMIHESQYFGPGIAPTIREIVVKHELIFSDVINKDIDWRVCKSEKEREGLLPLEYYFARTFLAEMHVSRDMNIEPDIEIDKQYDLNSYKMQCI